MSSLTTFIDPIVLPSPSVSSSFNPASLLDLSCCVNILIYTWLHHLFSKLVFFFDFVPFPASGGFCIESSPVISG